MSVFTRIVVRSPVKSLQWWCENGRRDDGDCCLRGRFDLLLSHSRTLVVARHKSLRRKSEAGTARAIQEISRENQTLHLPRRTKEVAVAFPPPLSAARMKASARQNWWSRGESNPRPQVLRYKIYVRSRVYCSHRALPNGQGKHAASPVIFRLTHPRHVCSTI